MEGKRSIEITLEKAKEWYNNGGELREIALQAFSEKEILSSLKAYGTRDFVNGLACYVIGFDEYGTPNAWISEKITKKFSNFREVGVMSKDEALAIPFTQGWHIPSFSEMEELKKGIRAAAGAHPNEINYVMWNTSPSDTLCYWGLNERGEGTRVRFVHAILRK